MLTVITILCSLILLVLCCIPKLINSIMWKLQDNEIIVYFIVTVASIIFSVTIYYRVLKDGRYTIVNIIFIICICSLLIWGVISIFDFVTEVLLTITDKVSNIFDSSKKYLVNNWHEFRENRRRKKYTQGMHVNKEAEVGLMYFIREEENKKKCYVKFL